MKKKILTAAVFIVAFALAASATFAGNTRPDPRNNNQCCDRKDECCPEVKVDANTDTTVRNDIEAKANTGDNYISSQSHSKPYVRTMNSSFVMPFYNTSEAKIETGVATAINTVGTEVYGSQVMVDMPRKGTVDIDADTDTYVKNEVEARANTGDNTIRVSSGRAKVETGDAYSDNLSSTKVVGSYVEVK